MDKPKPRMFSCPQCSYQSPFANNVKRHILVRHSANKPFGCKVKGCNYRFNRDHLLDSHIKMFHPGIAVRSSFDCAVQNCSFTTKTYRLLQLHVQRIHDPNRRNKHECPLCTHCTFTWTELNIHMRTHTREKRLACDLCSYETNTRDSLKSHLGSVHQKRDSNGKLLTPARKELQCPHPGCDYRTIHGLGSHMKRHQPDEVSQKYKCTFPGCTYKSKEGGNLRRHLRQKHDPNHQKPHGCPICSKAFHHAFELRAHVGRHTNEKTYKCNECEFATVYRENLYRHKRQLHLEKLLGKPFACDECDYRGKTNKQLMTHVMNIHTGEKLLQCSHEGCDYKTNYGNELIRHKWKHETNFEDQNPIICLLPGCQARFNSYGGLSRHAKSVHGLRRKRAEGVVYHCEKCSFKSRDKKNFKIHSSLHGLPTISCNLEDQSVRRPKEGTTSMAIATTAAESDSQVNMVNCFVLLPRIHMEQE